MSKAILISTIAGAYCPSACGQEFTIVEEWPGYSEVNTRRELPGDCKLGSHLAVTRTGITDDTSDATDEVDQWTDDLWVARNVAHLHCATLTKVGSDTWLLDGTRWHESMPERLAEARAELELLRQLTDGMWNWTFRQCRQGGFEVFRGFHRFCIAGGEAMTLGGYLR